MEGIRSTLELGRQPRFQASTVLKGIAPTEIIRLPMSSFHRISSTMETTVTRSRDPKESFAT